MEWKIPLFKSYWREADIKAMNGVIRRGSYYANGPEVSDFERELAAFAERKYGLVFNSGTSALHSVLMAHDVRGFEVIVPSFTFIATANCVLLAHGKPVFAEIEEESYGLDVNDVSERITEKTKAIVPVHYAGAPCRDTVTLRELADDHGLLLIEDAAESMGSMINGKPVGGFGDAGMFSFCQNKIVTTGEGGAIVTDSRDVYEKLKLIRSQGRVEDGNDYFSSTSDMDYILPGYNYRMPTVLAAMGLSQLRDIGDIIKKRRDNAAYMNDGLSGIDGIVTPGELASHHHVYQMYTIRMEDPERRDLLQEHLAKKGIMTKVYFNPVHLKTLYRKDPALTEGSLPRTEELSKKVLTLPMHPLLERGEMDYIIGEINNFFLNV